MAEFVFSYIDIMPYTASLCDNNFLVIRRKKEKVVTILFHFLT